MGYLLPHNVRQELAMSFFAAPLAEELASLVEKAMKHPGVADVMRVYDQYENMLAQTRAYLQVLNPQPVFSVTDSTSQ